MSEEARMAAIDGPTIAQQAARIAELERELTAAAEAEAAQVRRTELQTAELAALVCGVRFYAARHRLAIGECVAWTLLKQLLGVGESDEADRASWETYRRLPDTAYAQYTRRHISDAD